MALLVVPVRRHTGFLVDHQGVASRASNNDEDKRPELDGGVVALGLFAAVGATEGRDG